MRWKERLLNRLNSTVAYLRSYKVASIDDTLQEMNDTEKPLIRFGDGEMRIIFGGHVGFQEYDPVLREHLKKILQIADPRIILCVPGPIGNNFDGLSEDAVRWWNTYCGLAFFRWAMFLRKNYLYYNSLVTRFYIDIADINRSKKLASGLKSLWKQKNVLLIEGEKTRGGVGNDLFDEAISVRRILCPAENAFQKYDKILRSVIEEYKQGELVLVSLGPTAKVLVYDLFIQGIRAFDVGHIDNEYEWMKIGKHKRSAIEGKYVNEVENGRNVREVSDEKYMKEIIRIIK